MQRLVKQKGGQKIENYCFNCSHYDRNTAYSPQYIQEATEKTATPNIVTAVLADYRSYDTMGETVVVFTAAIGCILMLRKKRNGEGG